MTRSLELRWLVCMPLLFIAWGARSALSFSSTFATRIYRYESIPRGFFAEISDFFSMSISMSGQFSIANPREPPRSFVARRWPGAGAAPEFPCLRNRVQSFVYSMAILRSTQNTAVSLRSIILPCTADSSSVLFPPLPALAFLSFGSGDLRAGSVTSGLLCSSLS